MSTRGLLLVAAAVALATPADAVDPSFEVCAASFPLTPLQRVIFATNGGSARLDAITAEGYVDAAALEAGTTWDFTPLTGSDRVVQFVPVDPAWSCSVAGSCNRFGAADALLVEDDLSSGRRSVNAIDYDGAQTVYLRAQVTDEGSPTELRICFQSDVQFLRFPRAGDCLAEGDPDWRTALDCDRSPVLDDPCGRADPQAGLRGSITGRTVRNGTMTLPSGHVVDAVLVEAYVSAVAEALVFNLCSFEVERLDQYLLLWIVPEYGPIAQLSSPSGATDLSWQTAGSTTIGYGLLPPVSARVDAVADDSITISWDPGRLGGLVPDEWVVHWGEQPGQPTTTSQDVGDTIPGTQLSYTIAGLMPGSDYCVSVSSLATYTDPVSGLATTYESIALPASIGADVDGDGSRDTSYPPEVCARTTGMLELPLLRDDEVTDVDPAMIPSRDMVLPLVSGDVYRPMFVPGSTDPDLQVLDDADRPLVFYGWDAPRTIFLTVAPGRLIHIE